MIGEGTGKDISYLRIRECFTLPQSVQQPTPELDSQEMKYFTLFVPPCWKGYRVFCHNVQLNKVFYQHEAAAPLI